MSIFDLITPVIAEAEGLSLKMYKDSEGLLTIGYGHCLEKKGISQKVADLLFQEDLADALKEARKLPEFDALDTPRQAVLVEMVYQLGLQGVMNFKKMRAAIAIGDWSTARSEMLDSRWFAQTPKRAFRLASAMENGVYS